MGAASSVQTQMQTEHDPNAAFPWWIRFVAKGLGILGGFVAMFFAILGLLSLSPTCILAVLLQLAAGFLIIALEAPFCCTFVDFIERIALFSESRAYWQKGVLYVTMGALPIFLCTELNTVLGGGMIFASGIAYGVMALGKKADRDTMLGSGSNGSSSAWTQHSNEPGPPSGFNQP